MTFTPAGRWRGTINEILFAVQFGALNDETVAGVANAMIERRFLVTGPAVYLAAVQAALASGEALVGGAPVPHAEEDFRAFLGRLRDRLLATQPWPEPSASSQAQPA
jgi:hypothetical protein